MSLEDILDDKTDLKLGKGYIIAAIKLPIPQPTDSFWSHKVRVTIPAWLYLHYSCPMSNAQSTSCCIILTDYIRYLLQF